MSAPEISIIIPAYNEEARLPRYLGEILDFLKARQVRGEVIVVDDGSRDATPQLVEEFSRNHPQVRLVRLPENRGKGHAVRTGMLQGEGELLLFTDADGATPIAELDRLRRAYWEGADVAVGSRALRDDSRTVRAHLHRKVMGGVFNLLVGTFAVGGIKDTQCGFKLFTKKAARAVFPLQRIDGFGFDVELLFLLRRKGFRVDEVPVNWSDIGGSKVGLVRDSLRMFGDIFRIRLNELRGAYRT